MSATTQKKIENWQKSYGALATFLWRALFYPVLALVLYSASSYLDSHYVDRAHFDSSMQTLAVDKERYNEETQAHLKEINSKLDTVIVTQSAVLERAANLNERVIRLENWRDGRAEKVSLRITAYP